jgi:hypothetical protein
MFAQVHPRDESELFLVFIHYVAADRLLLSHVVHVLFILDTVCDIKLRFVDYNVSCLRAASPSSFVEHERRALRLHEALRRGEGGN